jgi:hypothetical protein
LACAQERIPGLELSFFGEGLDGKDRENEGEEK